MGKGRWCCAESYSGAAEGHGGVTQSELADAVNVSRQTIISLENGRYNASLILAHKIAKYFDVAIEELFLFDDTDE